MSLTVTHVGFSDESKWNTGRFRSLGLVTAPLDALDQLEGELRRLLEESGVHEFKWRELGGARERFAAEKMCRFAIDEACRKLLRVDVLVWDIQDSRHSVPRRDDIANLQRMYYHLFHNVMRERWPNNAVWRLYPDEHTAIDWKTLQAYLERGAFTTTVDSSLLTPGGFRLQLRQEFRIEEIQPTSSTDHPLLQLADLFAGMAVFSREKYQKWLRTSRGQVRLLHNEEGEADPSRSERERFQLLSKFDRMCKERKLGVSLETKQGLWTPNPTNPLNFWMYEPQHPGDRAPTRR